MSDVPPKRNEPLPATLGPRLDSACQRFEAAWKAGLAPRIEGHLGAAAGAERAALLKELIGVEVSYRRARGEAVASTEYLRRFPELDAAWLESALAPATLANASPSPGSAETRPHDGPAPAPRPPGRRFRSPVTKSWAS